MIIRDIRTLSFITVCNVCGQHKAQLKMHFFTLLFKFQCRTVLKVRHFEGLYVVFYMSNLILQKQTFKVSASQRLHLGMMAKLARWQVLITNLIVRGVVITKNNNKKRRKKSCTPLMPSATLKRRQGSAKLTVCRWC